MRGTSPVGQFQYSNSSNRPVDTCETANMDGAQQFAYSRGASVPKDLLFQMITRGSAQWRTPRKKTWPIGPTTRSASSITDPSIDPLLWDDELSSFFEMFVAMFHSPMASAPDEKTVGVTSTGEPTSICLTQSESEELDAEMEALRRSAVPEEPEVISVEIDEPL